MDYPLGSLPRLDSGIQYESLFAVGSTLFVITLIFNIGATWFVNRFREEYQ